MREQKKLWKEESEQLKKDLQNRPKQIKLNPKEIKFGGVKKSNLSKPKVKYSKDTDSYFRKFLGI